MEPRCLSSISSRGAKLPDSCSRSAPDWQGQTSPTGTRAESNTNMSSSQKKGCPPLLCGTFSTESRAPASPRSHRSALAAQKVASDRNRDADAAEDEERA